MDVRAFNRRAWDAQVAKGNPWTVPVSHEQVLAARQDDWSLLLTPSIPVPREWYPPLAGADVLCLASGGGQQGPILAAAGAHVTVYDNSTAQLARDREVADREGLEIATVEGDMRDLSVLPDEAFDLVFHPVANVFVPEVMPVWREAYRVLRPGGVLLAGFNNPVTYLFDLKEMVHGRPVARYRLPYSDLDHLSPADLEVYQAEGYPLEWSHTLDEQIGGQIAAGFMLSGFYEDSNPYEALSEYCPGYIATRALKL